MKVIIIGAGVGGLASAIALAQKAIPVAVYERRPALSHLGAGIVCWPNASFVLQRLGIVEDLSKVAGRPLEMQRISAEGDNLGAINVEQINQSMGYLSYSVLRRDLMQILEARAKSLGVEIFYNQPVETIVTRDKNRAEVILSDQSREYATLIIAADGRMRSLGRAYVVGDNQARFQKFINWIGIIGSSAIDFSHIKISDYWGVGKRFGVVPISSHLAYWAAGLASNHIGDVNPKLYRAQLKQHFHSWPQPVPAIIELSEIKDIHQIFVHDHDPIDCWYRENVLLIGDAAHAPLPTSGQGACQALEDGWLLAELIADHKSDLSTVFKKFVQMRKQKTTSITMAARSFAQSLFNSSPEYCAQRNLRSQSTDFNAAAGAMAQLWSQALPISL